MTEKSKPIIYWHVHPLAKEVLPKDFVLGQEYVGSFDYWGEDTAKFVNSHNQFYELLDKVSKSPNQIIALLPEVRTSRDEYVTEGFGNPQIDELVRRLDKEGKLVRVGIFPGIDGVENLQRQSGSLLESELIDCDHIITGLSTPNCGSTTATMVKDGIVYSQDRRELILTDKPIARPKRVFWDPRYTTTSSPDGIMFIRSGLMEGTGVPFVGNRYNSDERVRPVPVVN